MENVSIIVCCVKGNVFIIFLLVNKFVIFKKNKFVYFLKVVFKFFMRLFYMFICRILVCKECLLGVKIVGKKIKNSFLVVYLLNYCWGDLVFCMYSFNVFNK